MSIKLCAILLSATVRGLRLEDEIENQLNMTNELLLLAKLEWKPRVIQKRNGSDIKTKKVSMRYKAEQPFLQELYLLWAEHHEC